MKRCPQCSFLYLDSDQLCDLDKTPLIAEDFGTDLAVESAEENSERAQLTDPERILLPKFNWQLTQRILLAVIVGVFAFGLTSLIAYQRTRSKLQVSQTATTSQAQAPQALRVSQVAQQASNEVATKAEITQQASTAPDVPNDSTPPSAEPSPSTTAKTNPNPRPESARVRPSSNPVSTSDASNSGPGPVTIQLSDGSMLEADEVWRTKAGIWYRRKGIVTFIKPTRVRTINH
jgi:cytoskeletal protein RodZ